MLRTALMRRGRAELVAAAVVALAAAALASCTTFVEPTSCAPGSSACAGIHDARFCDEVALSVEGAGCAALGVAETKHFCVVTPVACTETNYVVEYRDCRVLRYQTV